MSHSIEELDAQIIIQHRENVRDPIGGLPYSWPDYLKGGGNGIYAGFQDPTAEDILTAAQHQQQITHTIIVRYDKRIKSSMRVKYWNGTEYEYYKITTTVDEKFEHRFMRLLAKITTEDAE